MSLLDHFDLVIGADTEFVHGLDGIPVRQNAIVSYQAAYWHPRTDLEGSGVYGPSGPRKAQRHALASYLARVIKKAAAEGADIFADLNTEHATLVAEAAQSGRRKRPKRRKLRIALVMHFSRADLPGFYDFKALRKTFDGVRGTYASVKRPTIRSVRMPNNRYEEVSITLFDTMLLAPARRSSLKALGQVLEFEKLTVPQVVDPTTGETFAGITRMDLVARQHPAAFKAYAERDCKVAIAYLRAAADFAEDWGLARLPPTVASIAAKWLQQNHGIVLPEILGRARTKMGRIGEFLPEARAIQGLCADAFHGGRNEAFVHGIFTAAPDRPFLDLDLKGAYTSAMSPFRPLDWAAIEHTIDIERLATFEDPAVATVDFRFSADVRFPCLPVPTGDGGLVYPLSGSTTCTGAELVVARSLGATLLVRAGIRVPWLDRNGRNDERPMRDLARHVNRARARYSAEGKTIFDELAKEGGNSGYGKLGQGVGSMKTDPADVRIFDTRLGAMQTLPISSVTSPLLAAMTSGLVRAVLSEILSRLPRTVRVLSATTDGWFSDATLEEALAATQGPVCRYFGELRANVDPDGSADILSVKHRALSVLIARTRHGVTIEPCEGSKRFIARAGHRIKLETDDLSEEQIADVEAAAFVQLQRDRTFETFLKVSSLISLSKQWEEIADLIEESRDARVALCYDMKRAPIAPVDFDGLIQFETRPWETLEDCLEWRDSIDRWKGAARAVLKTSNDWQAFLAWRRDCRRKAFAQRTPFENAVLIAWAKGLEGFPIRNGAGRPTEQEDNLAGDAAPTKNAVAAILTDLGVKGVKRATIDNARRFENDPTASVAVIFSPDIEFAKRLQKHIQFEALERLLEPATRAAFRRAAPASEIA